jgi:hypothetical protein
MESEMAEQQQPQQKPEPSARKKRQLERLALVKSLTQAPRVRVVPTNDELRKVLKHPSGGIAFHEGSTSVEWPFDTFTKNRIRDGDVTIEERQQEEGETKPQTGSKPPPSERSPQQPPTTS